MTRDTRVRWKGAPNEGGPIANFYARTRARRAPTLSAPQWPQWGKAVVFIATVVEVVDVVVASGVEVVGRQPRAAPGTHARRARESAATGRHHRLRHIRPIH